MLVALTYSGKYTIINAFLIFLNFNSIWSVDFIQSAFDVWSNSPVKTTIIIFQYEFVDDFLFQSHVCVRSGMLELAARQGIQFSVVLTEGRSEGNAVRVSKALMRAGIPVTLVLDSAVAFVMDRTDLVLIGASAVVENGGIINTVIRQQY